MRQDIQAAITRAANEAGIDPAFALAVADRESDGIPTKHASQTIYGLYQMRGDLRKRYGGADANSSDPYAQAKMWTGFIGGVRSGMAARLGRDPTPAELYMGHYFGEGRASNLIRNPALAAGAPEDVFSKQEMLANDNFRRAPSIGALMGGIRNDIDQRQARFSQGASAQQAAPNGTQKGPGTLDFGQFGEPAQPDFGQFGQSPDEARGAIPDVRPGLTIPGSAPVVPASLQRSGASGVAGSPGAPGEQGASGAAPPTDWRTLDPLQSRPTAFGTRMMDWLHPENRYPELDTDQQYRGEHPDFQSPDPGGAPPASPMNPPQWPRQGAGDMEGGGLWSMAAKMAPNGIPGVEDWRPSTNIEDDRGLGAKLGMIGDRFMHNAKAIGAAVGIGGDNAQDNADTTPAPRPGVEVDLTPYTMNSAGGGAGTGW